MCNTVIPGTRCGLEGGGVRQQCDNIARVQDNERWGWQNSEARQS